LPIQTSYPEEQSETSMTPTIKEMMSRALSNRIDNSSKCLGPQSLVN
jgi:hypothetical protein